MMKLDGTIKVEESLIRELCRIQDTLKWFVPDELWHKWAEANEEILSFLQENS